MPKVVRIIARLNIGGPAIHTILLADRLRPEYETVLVSGTESPTEGNMLALANRLDVRVDRIGQLGREINPFIDLIAIVKVIQLIRRERPDIVHTHTAKAGFVGRIAARLCRVPVIVHTFHGHVFHGGYFDPGRTRLFLLLERALAKFSSRIVTVNEHQRRDLIQLGIAPAEKIVAIPLGLDLRNLAQEPGDPSAMREKWGVPLDAQVVGIVARLVPVKGHELFLDAAAEVRRSHPDARFVLVGDGQRRLELEAYARKLKLPVVFTGWETDVNAVYAALDVVCLTSLNEGSPVALIEALTAGKAVVSTAAGGVKGLIRHEENGLLINDRDPVAFARAICRLLENPEEGRALGLRGKNFVYPHHDIGRLAADIRCLYEQLLEGART